MSDVLPFTPTLRLPPTPAQEKIITLVKGMTEAEQLENFDYLSLDDLEVIEQEMAPVCDCARVYMACDCGVVCFATCTCQPWCTSHYAVACPDCGMEPEVEPCRHAKTSYLSPLVLENLRGLIYEEPPMAPQRSASMTQVERAGDLALRHGPGPRPLYRLWRPDDAIHDDPTSEVNDALERDVCTKSGWKQKGSPTEIPEPLSNGHVVFSPTLKIRRGNHAVKPNDDIRKVG